MDETAISYAAGLFDGEGSVNLSSKGKDLKIIRTSVANTCKDLLDFLSDNFGGMVYTKAPRMGTRQQYEWVATGQAAISFLRTIRPHMKETNKIARADLAIRDLHPLMSRPGINLTPEQRIARRAVEEMIAAI